jgi:hypothetical protein
MSTMSLGQESICAAYITRRAVGKICPVPDGHLTEDFRLDP